MEKWTFAYYVKMKYCYLKSLFSHLEHYSVSCVGLFQRKWDSEELSNFCGNHGLTPVEKCTFAYYVKMKYCYLKSLFCHLEHYSISCVGLFERKWDWEEFQIFEGS